MFFLADNHPSPGCNVQNKPRQIDNYLTKHPDTLTRLVELIIHRLYTIICFTQRSNYIELRVTSYELRVKLTIMINMSEIKFSLLLKNIILLINKCLYYEKTHPMPCVFSQLNTIDISQTRLLLTVS